MDSMGADELLLVFLHPARATIDPQKPHSVALGSRQETGKMLKQQLPCC
jgi:hypothetical protein